MPPPVPAGTIAGSIATDGTLALNPDQKKIDMADRIFAVDPEATPILTIISNGTPKESATEVQFKWLEDAPIPEWLKLASGVANNALSLTLVTGTGQYIMAPTILRNYNTGEAILISSVSGDVLTVPAVSPNGRGWGGTTAAAIATTDNLLNLRNNQQQGAATAPQSLSTLKTTKSNYVQIVTHSVKVNKTVDAVELYGGSERLYQRGMRTAEHARAWEQILMHGVQSAQTSGANPTFTTGGLDYYLSANTLSLSGQPLAESQFMAYMGTVFRYSVNPGKKSKVLYASQEIINTINGWGTAKLVTTPNADKASQRYGIDIREYVSGFGRLSVVFHPLLEVGSAGSGYILDMDGVSKRDLRPTKMDTNVQAPEADFYLDKILTEAGFRVAMDPAHGRITGVAF